MGGIMGVRVATTEDIPVIVEMAKVMHEQSDYASVPFVSDMYSGFLNIIFENEDYRCFVYEKDGVIIGAIIGLVAPYMFSPDIFAVDAGFFVMPGHRGGMAAIRLESAYTEWAVWKAGLIGQESIKIRLCSSTGDIRAGAFFEKIGYNFVGGNYCRDVRC